MDELPEALLLEILSRVIDSADVARCRVALKGFNTLYPHLRSLNLQCTSRMCYPSTSRFRTIFLNLISNMPVVESVCIGVDEHFKLERALVQTLQILRPMRKPIKPLLPIKKLELGEYDLNLVDPFFLEKWLPRVSVHLKSLSVSNHPRHRSRKSNVLLLLSANCHNLAVLKLKNVCLCLQSLDPMPMMISLTLDSINLLDTKLIELIKCLPNLQVLNLMKVFGLKYPKIHLLNLKIFQLTVSDGVSGGVSNISLITPNLVTLRLECTGIRLIHIQSPKLSHFHLDLDYLTAFRAKKFEYLKTFTLSASITSILYELPVLKTVENLTMDTPRCFALQKGNVNSKFIFGKLFTVFPNMSYLCIKLNAWRVLEVCYIELGREQTLYLKKKLKRFSAYLLLADPSLTFSCVDFVLSQCIEVSNVSLFIHGDVDSNVSKSFISRCMTRWPEMKWRWGTWKKEMEDSRIDD